MLQLLSIHNVKAVQTLLMQSAVAWRATDWLSVYHPLFWLYCLTIRLSPTGGGHLPLYYAWQPKKAVEAVAVLKQEREAPHRWQLEQFRLDPEADDRTQVAHDVLRVLFEQVQAQAGTQLGIYLASEEIEAIAFLQEAGFQILGKRRSFQVKPETLPPYAGASQWRRVRSKDAQTACEQYNQQLSSLLKGSLTKTLQGFQRPTKRSGFRLERWRLSDSADDSACIFLVELWRPQQGQVWELHLYPTLSQVFDVDEILAFFYSYAQATTTEEVVLRLVIWGHHQGLIEAMAPFVEEITSQETLFLVKDLKNRIPHRKSFRLLPRLNGLEGGISPA